MPDRLALDIPADVRSLRSARLATFDAAARAGLDCDDADDLCLALDEVCFAAFAGAGADDRIRLEITVDHGVEIQGWTDASPHAFSLSTFADLLVDLVIDEHAIESALGGVHFTLRKNSPVVPA